MLKHGWLFIALLFIGSCAFSPETNVPLLSPSGDGDQTIGYKSETVVSPSAEADEGPAGGIVGKIGGDGDSVSLWIAIVVLGIVAVSAYPAQRMARLGWNSWRGSTGKPRKGKGKETKICIETSEWES